MRPKREYGGIIDANNLQTLKEQRDMFYLLSFILHNTKPVGHQVSLMLILICVGDFKFLILNIYFYELQDLVGLVISMLLLGDFSLVLLTLLQLYSISLVDVFLVLFILPLGILLPFPAGINALFSHGPRRSAGLARLYALWNLTSLFNVVSFYFWRSTSSLPSPSSIFGSVKLVDWLLVYGFTNLYHLLVLCSFSRRLLLVAVMFII